MTFSHKLGYQNVPYHSPCHGRAKVPLPARTQDTASTALHMGTAWDTHVNEKKNT